MKVKGTAFWAYTKTPDTKFDPCWRITLQISDEDAKKLKDVGLKPKRNDDGIFEYKFRRLVARKKTGGENKAPRVVDAKKNDFNGIIGNGSLVNVQFAPFSWEYKGKKGTSADLQAVQILQLVEFSGSPDADEFDEEEGTVVTTADDDDDDSDFVDTDDDGDDDNDY